MEVYKQRYEIDDSSVASNKLKMELDATPKRTRRFEDRPEEIGTAIWAKLA